jgi:ectoine hydroxylase-related dioxygenase (phytanoyl-CoA dioxygenase family)
VAGCCLIDGLISAEHAFDLRRLVHDRAEDERRNGVGYVYSGDAHQRVWLLLNAGRPFLELAEDVAAREVVGAILGPDAILSNLSANITGPGGAGMVPHWDQDWAPRPWSYPLVAHVIWMLDDFTEDNGPTLVVPGSHLTDEPPGSDELEPVVGRSGTALVIDGRLWHGTSPNISAGRRTGLLAYYCRPFVRQQENFALSLDSAVRDTLTESQRTLLGLEFYEYLNMVGGPPPSLPRY